MKSILFKLSAVFFVFFFSSCKEKVKDIPKEELGSGSLDLFQFIVDIKVKDTTDLILYYKDGGNEWFIEEKAIWNNVKANDAFQTVVFDFEEDIVPNDFRLDIGRNEFKNQQPIEIKKITMNYFGNTFGIEQDQVNFFFKPNQYLIYNEGSKQYVLQQDEIGNYDPYFETAPTIYPHIVNLVMGNSIK